MVVPQRFWLSFDRAMISIKRLPRIAMLVADYTTDPQKLSVIPSMVLFYSLCMANGLYNTFVVTAPTQVLEDPLLPLQYDVFVFITFLAPLLTLIGMSLRGKWAWTGAWTQLLGNIGVAGVLWTYIVALIGKSWWGAGNFSGTWVLGSAIGSVIFIIRDIRRLRDPDLWVAPNEHD